MAARQLKILTFTTLYPSSVRPRHGIFVESRLCELLRRGHIEARVVAPVPWFPIGSERFGRYAEYARTPEIEERRGLTVLHPRYPMLPGVGMYLQPYALALGAYSSVRSLLRGGFDFDLIDAHYFYPDGVAAALLARRFKKPVVITARGTDINLLPSYALPKSLILWAARQANAVITVSGALKRKLGELGADANEIRVIRNGVDLQFFKPGPVDTARRTLHLPQGPLIASVGNLVPEKGHDLVIRALQLMPSVKLVIVGDGPERMRLASLASTARVNERVFFRPAMPQQDLADVYRSVDVLVLASSREGWPNVLLEAMACGTPVVAADVGGVREIVASVEAGIVLSERTPDGIASAVQDLLRVPRSRASVREYAERFGWGSVCSDLSDLLSRVVERSQLAPIKRASAAV